MIDDGLMTRFPKPDAVLGSTSWWGPPERLAVEPA